MTGATRDDSGARAGESRALIVTANRSRRCGRPLEVQVLWLIAAVVAAVLGGMGRARAAPSDSTG